jgi:hypothetical protein
VIRGGHSPLWAAEPEKIIIIIVIIQRGTKTKRMSEDYKPKKIFGSKSEM